MFFSCQSETSSKAFVLGPTLDLAQIHVATAGPPQRRIAAVLDLDARGERATGTRVLDQAMLATACGVVLGLSVSRSGHCESSPRWSSR